MDLFQRQCEYHHVVRKIYRCVYHHEILPSFLVLGGALDFIFYIVVI